MRSFITPLKFINFLKRLKNILENSFSLQVSKNRSLQNFDFLPNHVLREYVNEMMQQL